MSKWTAYQGILVLFFGLMIVGNYIFKEQVTSLFPFIEEFIPSSVLIIFFTIILVIWGFSVILLMEEKKGKQLFEQKVWRIMPAILGGWLLISIIGILILGVTVLSNVDASMKWLLDVLVVYVMSVFHLFILSIVIRYGKANTAKGRIHTAANFSILILMVVIFLMPGL